MSILCWLGIHKWGKVKAYRIQGNCYGFSRTCLRCEKYEDAFRFLNYKEIAKVEKLIHPTEEGEK